MIIQQPVYFNGTIQIDSSYSFNDICVNNLELSGSLMMNGINIYNEISGTIDLSNINVSNSLIINKMNVYDTLIDLCSQKIINTNDDFYINNVNVYNTLNDLSNNTLSSEHLQMEKVDISDEILFKDDIEISGNISANIINANSFSKKNGLFFGYRDSSTETNVSTNSILDAIDLSYSNFNDLNYYHLSGQNISILKPGYYMCNYTFNFENYQYSARIGFEVNTYYFDNTTSGYFDLGTSYSYTRGSVLNSYDTNNNSFIFYVSQTNIDNNFYINFKVNITNNLSAYAIYDKAFNYDSGNVMLRYLGN